MQAISYHSIESLVTFCDNHNMLINPITIDRPTSFHISALSTESKQKFLDNTFCIAYSAGKVLPEPV